MMKCKKIKFLIILLVVLFILSSEVLAMSEWLGQAKDFISTGKNEAVDEGLTTDTSALKTRFCYYI